jgi:predicted molibdopterin-dependent oxidoreductase YjgC
VKPRHRRGGRGPVSVRSPYDLVEADPEASYEVDVDGRPVRVVPGQTLGAALVATGIRAWRRTRHDGQPRGLFCGIGVCFDCLVTVNGRPSQRACLVEARPGDVVTTQEGSGHDELAC